ncbi:uncharacterized protein LOC113383610 [Ctenocephalides felis]|uniref:uncharacterized protein LOC113383610 n=1 Tax=Ctenocephalides felis TaxID=7515 RepID=UPI000E6E3C82|nr:uncharacterized protein LOC113383610 [Ctenocephalides felis]
MEPISSGFMQDVEYSEAIREIRIKAAVESIPQFDGNSYNLFRYETIYASYCDLALAVFIEGLQLEIKTIVKGAKPKNLEEAKNIAIKEEKYLNITYGKQYNRYVVCRYCRKRGHHISKCEKIRQKSIYEEKTSFRQNGIYEDINQGEHNDSYDALNYGNTMILENTRKNDGIDNTFKSTEEESEEYTVENLTQNTETEELTTITAEILDEDEDEENLNIRMAEFEEIQDAVSGGVRRTKVQQFRLSNLQLLTIHRKVKTEFRVSVIDGPIIEFPSLLNFSSKNNSASVKTSGGFSAMEKHVIVPLYSIIFLLSFSGNLLVLLTLARNKRMRTVTNVYLLNLALSDLLLGVFCMPFTLVGQLLRNFIFGGTMCKLIPYFQAVSVSVGVWTLVAISLERYFAICRPLESRRWQTRKHAFKMIITVWICSLLWNGPILFVSRLQAMKSGHHKCREQWSSANGERIYNLFLDAVLLILPLLIMSLAYSLIVGKLWRGLKREIGQHNMTNNMLLIQGVRRSDSYPANNLLSETQVNTPINTSRSENSKYEQISINGSTILSNNKVAVRSKDQDCKQRMPKDKDNFGATQAVKKWLMKGLSRVRIPEKKSHRHSRRGREALSEPMMPHEVSSHYTFTRQAIRSNYMCKSIEAKKKVIRMLFVIIVEFFICWAPLHVLNTVRIPEKKSHRHSRRGREALSEPMMPHEVSSHYTFTRQAIRSNYMCKSIEAKKKVIRMLFVIIVEFFICWAPLHVLNTVYLFWPKILYDYVGPTGVALVQLLAYVSACCNPITYCFMNRRFREAFLRLFPCGSQCRSSCTSRHNFTSSHSNDVRCGDAIARSGDVRVVPQRQRSEVMILEAEDRV